MSQEAGGPKIKLNTGHLMPLIGFGTYKVADQETVDIAIDAALAVGYRQFDTAKFYNNEIELGNALEKLLPKHGLKREDIFITTKIWPNADENLEKLPEVIQDSLKSLKTSYIDLFLIHYPKSNERENDDEKNAENRKDCWMVLEKLSKQGILRSIGVSNYEVRHMEEIPKYSQVVPAVNQAFSSLGRHHPDLIGDPVVVELAAKYNTSAQQILLAFATCQSVGIVPKSESPERIRDNFKVSELKIAEEDLQRLNSIDKDTNYIRCTGWLVK